MVEQQGRAMDWRSRTCQRLEGWESQVLYHARWSARRQGSGICRRSERHSVDCVRWAGPARGQPVEKSRRRLEFSGALSADPLSGSGGNPVGGHGKHFGLSSARSQEVSTDTSSGRGRRADSRSAQWKDMDGGNIAVRAARTIGCATAALRQDRNPGGDSGNPL
jgi:hypothetical protein